MIPRLTISPISSVYAPLDRLEIQAERNGRLRVMDPRGRVYCDAPLSGARSVVVGGTIGTHIALLTDEEGRLLAEATFTVRCETKIADSAGRFSALLEQLEDTILNEWTSGSSKYLRINSKRYKYYVSWLRDHVHTLKGMRYFDQEVKTGIELYGDHPREDGMIWDKCKEMCHSELQNGRDIEFADGDYVRKIPGNPTRRWMRIPVENDVEYLFVEGLYLAWRASGDTAWMQSYLRPAMRALDYSVTSPVRWSHRFSLLKRGYTIDSWDFQTVEDARRSGSMMRINPEKTEFNIFHGDNTGYANSCRYLAEMLAAAGMETEALQYRERAAAIIDRLRALSWNGRFFTHMIPEQETAIRDLGDTETAEQITMANAYALNRGIPESDAEAIIEAYLRLRRETAESAPAEWFNCYPPFEKGFHVPKWEYMNGGISTIVAGELSRGAFAHGHETYGVDILLRVSEIARQYGGELPNCLKGRRTDRGPSKTAGHSFFPIDIDAYAHAALRSPPLFDIGGLAEVGPVYRSVPFRIAGGDQAKEARMLALARAEGFKDHVTIDIGRACGAICFLHTAAGKLGGWDKMSLVVPGMVRSQTVVGRIEVEYQDGTSAVEYVQTNRNLENCVLPPPDMVQGHARRTGPYRIAWQGKNDTIDNVGVFLYCYQNPHPDKPIARLRLIGGASDRYWLVAGITLADKPIDFDDSALSYGIPSMWGASALVQSLLEGLAGITETAPGFGSARIAPRWAAANETEAEASVVYPASGGYAKYRYRFDPKTERIDIDLATCADEQRFEILLPNGYTGGRVLVDGEPASEIESLCRNRSTYVCFTTAGVNPKSVRVLLERQ